MSADGPVYNSEIEREIERERCVLCTTALLAG